MKRALNILMGIVVALCIIGFGWPQLRDTWLRNLGYRELLHGNMAGFASLVEAQRTSSDQVVRSRLRASVLAKDFDRADAIARQFESGIDAYTLLWLGNQALSFVDAGDVPGAIATLDLALSYGQESASYKVLAVGWRHVATTLYNMQEWQQVVDVLGPVWASAHESLLNTSEWCSAALMLASSLQRLDRAADAEDVYRQLVSLDPSACDWQMNNAQITLGDIELSRGNLASAMEHYALAYNIALEVLPRARVAYEENAWGRLERLADAMVGSPQADILLTLLWQKVGSTPDNPGLNILWGLVCEKRCDLHGARAAYTAAGHLVTDSGFIGQRLERLPSVSCSPDAP